MAQEVHYIDEDIEFKEGPFVICNPLGNGWRIESQHKMGNTSTLPDTSIYIWFRKTHNSPLTKFCVKEQAAQICDELNQLVKNKKALLHPDGYWFIEGYI